MSKQAQYAKIHIARKELNIDEDSYRAMLMRITGQASLTTCNHYHLEAVINELKSKGFKPKSKFKGKAKDKSKRASSTATPDMRDKALSVWIELERTGIVGNGSDAAFSAYCKKTSKVDHWHWMTDRQAYSVIEGLKGWLARETLKQLRSALAYHGTIYSDDEILEISGASVKGIKSMGRMTAAMSNNMIRMLAQRHGIKNIVDFINSYNEVLS